jgi:hypothetical protein
VFIGRLFWPQYSGLSAVRSQYIKSSDYFGNIDAGIFVYFLTQTLFEISSNDVNTETVSIAVHIERILKALSIFDESQNESQYS